MEENKEEKIIAFLTGECDEGNEQLKSEGKTFQEFDQAWELAGTAYSYRNSEPDVAWAKLNEKLDHSLGTAPEKRFRFLRYAAIFAALLAVGSLTYLLTDQSGRDTASSTVALPEMMVFQTVAKPTEPTEIILPDGSMVKLNAGSSLQYPKQFTGSDRRVKLTGEGYFEVKHESTHPFIVEVNNVQIEDLGTSFNISAYPARELVEVNVTSGSIRLTNTTKNETKVLFAGSNGKYLKKSGTLEVSNKLTTNYLSWMTRELTFHHTPLSSVFEQLENIYHVKVAFVEPKIANIPYTANFDKFQLGDIVNVIAKTHHLTVRKEGDGFVFALK